MQAAIEERIAHLEQVIKEAKIVAHDKKGGVVGLGSEVSIKRGSDKTEYTYHIVGSEEANIHEHKLSYLSPLGEALMGKTKGESFEFETPSGKQSCTILKVK
jgi:transcription elongation factor GreA